MMFISVSMIKIFSTNIDSKKKADLTIAKLLCVYPKFKITIDIEDSDNILRVEGENFNANEIQQIIAKLGFKCQELFW